MIALALISAAGILGLGVFIGRMCREGGAATEPPRVTLVVVRGRRVDTRV